MISINPDRRVDLNAVCGKHYRYAEPRITQKLKDYNQPGQRAHYAAQISVNTAVTPRQLQLFLDWVGTELRKILKGSPALLQELQEELEYNHDVIIQALKQEKKRGSLSKPLTEMIEDIFGYSEFTKVELPGYYDGEYNELKQIALQIDNLSLQYRTNKGKLEQLKDWKSRTIIRIRRGFPSKGDLFLESRISSLIAELEGIPVQPNGIVATAPDFRQRLKAAVIRTGNLLRDRNELFLLNYANYARKYDTLWSAYHLVMELQLKVCPYCNRSYIHPYYSANSKTRADLDHFFPKSAYPYFAMSFYNLVPSCKVCNSSLKGGKSFDYGELLSPYEGGFGEDMNFTFDVDDVSAFAFMNPEHIQLRLEPRPGLDPDIQKKIEGNVKLFALEPMYSYHRDIVSEMIMKRMVYSDEWIDDVYDLFKYNPRTGEGFFRYKREVVEMLFSNYVTPDKSDKRILSKLTRDIAKELEFEI